MMGKLSILLKAMLSQTVQLDQSVTTLLPFATRIIKSIIQHVPEVCTYITSLTQSVMNYTVLKQDICRSLVTISCFCSECLAYLCQNLSS